ncbi:hypothetical protein CWE22_07960 [Pseudidiomarina aestuarii]|uniref:4'-phosphopantetheinyl transferase domain-containing protein n=1 Tax=Pseudidiomarina aestuarii TaxID=624146 RepID=A0A7Z7EUE5_9GAMM|nr:hypothetical protein [Pseudidiomarina aestuarii]RUO42068.1 hypothetical protein CWE22_07960 [Pseudidiomarina aestuarii]
MQSQVVCVYANLTEVDDQLGRYCYDSDNQPQLLRPQSQVTRALVRWCLEKYWSVSAEDVNFSRDQHGAVELWVNNEQWSVSVSHTDQCCAVAIARSGELGIDCERIRERRQRERLQQRFAKGYMQGVSSLVQFFERWTAAEAVTKAKRGSLMPTLALSFADKEPELHWHRHQDWQICCYSTASNNPPQWIDFSKNNHLS